MNPISEIGFQQLDLNGSVDSGATRVLDGSFSPFREISAFARKVRGKSPKTAHTVKNDRKLVFRKGYFER